MQEKERKKVLLLMKARSRIDYWPGGKAGLIFIYLYHKRNNE